MKHRYIFIFIIVFFSVSFLLNINVGAYSTLNLDRSNGVNVVSDTEGMLGLDHNDIVQTGDNNQELVTITNNHTETAYIDMYLLGDTIQDVNFSYSGDDRRYIELTPDESKTIYVDVNQGKNTAQYVNYEVDLIYESELSGYLERSVTEIQHNTITPPSGDIYVSYNEVGNSGNYTIDYSVGGDTTQYDRIDVYVNDSFVESRYVFEDTIKAKNIGATYEDTVTIEVIQGDEVLFTDSVTLS